MHFMVVIILVLLVISAATNDNEAKEEKPELESDSYLYTSGLVTSDDILFASTLDGKLVALDSTNGEVLWNLHEEPVVKSPYDSSKPVLPAFLPDPRDGSIYMIGAGPNEPLKKLPFTIPELVSASPCKSSDGILYTGKKVDTWFAVDRLTGRRQGSVSFNGCEAAGTPWESPDSNRQCPNLQHPNFLIGRTEYNIMMFDSRSAGGRKWNISFYDYSSNMGSGGVGADYEVAHFADSSTGKLVTLDRKSGDVIWKRSIGSPIVAMYKLDHGGDGIVNVPFTAVSRDTLIGLLEQFNAPDSRNEMIGETKLFPTLYVGEHDHGLYAMPSFVDEKALTIRTWPLLLEGPHHELPHQHQQADQGDPLNIPLPKDTARVTSLVFGYYDVPEKLTISLSPSATQLQLTGNSNSQQGHANNVPAILPPHSPIVPHPTEGHVGYLSTPRNDTGFDAAGIDEQFPAVHFGFKQLVTLNATFVFSHEFVEFGKELLPFTADWLMAMENKELKAITFLLAALLVVLFRFLLRNPLDMSNSFRMSSTSIRTNDSVGSYGGVTALPVELGDGSIQVGKITFDTKNILGKGCEGTFVYRGRFDNRDVAVKRVLANCFSIADREVELLRESDVHPNVIRYFCMEQDSQFRYIALELCQATLHDYVEGRVALSMEKPLDTLTMLRQATQGLNHLHNLDIVHRDVKPHNVLISLPGSKGDVRAMISDFGLCKKLNPGKLSFSRRSGVAGTEGWIAPEMMTGQSSNTCAVDIFSLGCVFHYVMSRGAHPFGASYKRQGNILSAAHDTSALGDNITCKSLVERMICHDARVRPSTVAVLKHPIFWSRQKVLAFLQDVSDRVDKEDVDSAILLSLERNRYSIVQGNWQEALDERVRDDLRKHRTYNPKAVRDLLRALRNKKHHYNELRDEVKAVYGRVPDQFADYWTGKFPRLLVHAYHVMHCVKNEPTFQHYFDKNYDFLQNHKPGEALLQQQLGPDGQRNPNLFEPAFRNGGARLQSDPDEEEEELGRRLKSQHSVVSNWSQLSGMRKEESDDAAFMLATNGHDSSDESAGDKPPDEPYPLTDSPLAEFATEPPEQSPRTRKGPAQLDSDAKQSYLKALAEKNAERRFSDALRNIPAQEKLPVAHDEREEGVEPRRPLDEPFLLTESPLAELTSNATERSPKVRKGPVQLESNAKQSYTKAMAEKTAERRFSDALRNIPAEEDIPVAEKNEGVIEPKSEAAEEEYLVVSHNSENERGSLEDGDQETVPETVGGGDNPAKIVWKLPPDENNKKKKKKSKNKKK